MRSRGRTGEISLLNKANGFSYDPARHPGTGNVQLRLSHSRSVPSWQSPVAPWSKVGADSMARVVAARC
jgi:hypothetical protein